MTRIRTCKRISMAMNTATGTHMRISTMDTAMPMAMATLMRASGTGTPTATTMDIHMRACTMVTAMATPTRATANMDLTTNIAMEDLGSLSPQASSMTWTLSLSGPM